MKRYKKQQQKRFKQKKKEEKLKMNNKIRSYYADLRISYEKMFPHLPKLPLRKYNNFVVDTDEICITKFSIKRYCKNRYFFVDTISTNMIQKLATTGYFKQYIL